jgi:hypothetical protein
MWFSKSLSASKGDKFNDDEPWETAPYPRVVNAFGLVGSAAVGDFGVTMMAGNRKIGNWENSTLGAAKVPLALTDIKPCFLYVPAGAPLVIEADEDVTTNPAVMTISVQRVRRSVAYVGGIHVYIDRAAYSVGTDYAEGEHWSKANYHRVIRQVGYVGDAVADSELEISVGNMLLANFLDSSAVLVPTVTDMMTCNLFAPSNRLIELQIVEAGGGAGGLELDIVPAGAVGIAGRRRYRFR